MTIIVDFSQVAISVCIVNLSTDLKKGKTGDESYNLIRHMVLYTILGFKRKYPNHGDILLAIDSPSYWRRDYFPAYKGQRKHGREESDLDWGVIQESIRKLKEEIREYLPWKVIETHGAEADDIIGVLSKYLQTNELVQDGIFSEEPQPIMICSADGDHEQLQKYKNVRQWSPLLKKELKLKGSAIGCINEHIAQGDGGDNIPNCLTSDQWAIDRANNIDDKHRQTPMKKTRLQEFIDLGIDGCKTEEEKRNWIRNRTLVDYDYIPDELQARIIQDYIDSKPSKNKMRMMTWFAKNRMKKLYDEAGSI